MSIKIGWYKTPVPEGREDKQLSHARILSEGTLNTKFMCKMIAQSSTISSADVKGVLEALNFWMGFYLTEGNSIELDGLGYFYPALKTEVITNDAGEEKVIARVDTVGFRCSTSLKEQVREAELEMTKAYKNNKLSPAKRKANILEYINLQVSINSAMCMKINNCTRYLALEDLKELVDAGKLLQAGSGKQTLYIRPYEQATSSGK